MDPMTGKKTRPVIGKLLTRSGGVDITGTSPRGPLDLKIVSPRGMLNYHDHVGGVGLGILAALHEKSTSVNTKPLDIEDEEEEEYTIVTRHLANNNNSYRKVYDGKGKTIFDISPAPARVHIKAPDCFLSRCHQCNKQLDGKDVYMYRGERAFCSTECRCREIWMEERSCSSEAEAASPCHTYPPAAIFAI